MRPGRVLCGAVSVSRVRGAMGAGEGSVCSGQQGAGRHCEGQLLCLQHSPMLHLHQQLTMYHVLAAGIPVYEDTRVRQVSFHLRLIACPHSHTQKEVLVCQRILLWHIMSFFDMPT